MNKQMHFYAIGTRRASLFVNRQLLEHILRAHKVSSVAGLARQNALVVHIPYDE